MKESTDDLLILVVKINFLLNDALNKNVEVEQLFGYSLKNTRGYLIRIVI